MNILIPMAGNGSRFVQAGYKMPKPLIEIRGEKMIEIVVNSLKIEGRHIFITKREHLLEYGLKEYLSKLSTNSEILTVDQVTEGACCTTLLAEDLINNDEPLLIVNSDQYVEWNQDEFLETLLSEDCDGVIATFSNDSSKWSYVRLDEMNRVVEVAEKRVISNLATVGIYGWKRGSDYVKYAKQMISKNIRVNGEFYVAPVFNEAIESGLIFRSQNVGKMFGLGTPEDLESFLALEG